MQIKTQVWDGSDEAKRWIEDNFDVTQYTVTDEKVYFHLWEGTKEVEKGKTMYRDKYGEPNVS